MKANQLKPCSRNDFGRVDETTSMQANRLVGEKAGFDESDPFNDCDH